MTMPTSTPMLTGQLNDVRSEIARAAANLSDPASQWTSPIRTRNLPSAMYDAMLRRGMSEAAAKSYAEEISGWFVQIGENISDAYHDLQAAISAIHQALESIDRASKAALEIQGDRPDFKI